MGSLRLHTGNRLETLIDLLARRLREPLDSVLEPELVMVQSKGMEHWISLELARRHGICANVRFPFPNTLVEDIHELVTDYCSPSDVFSPHRLRWHIFRHLRERLHDPLFEPVRTYLGGDRNGLLRFQLADRIADTFDQYLIFRPDMILHWEIGRDGDWQAELWRTLIREFPTAIHRAARGRVLLKALESPSAAGLLPARISVFGISALPRFHMDVLAAMARLIEVDLYLMNPCREYWGDIVSDRDIARTAARGAEGTDVADLHFEKGHPLLASTGMMGRDFFEMVHDYPVEEIERFHDPGEETLLHALQSDILRLHERGGDGTRTVLATGDDSIRVHSCHSPLREVEVLHDRLLELFERDPDLTPGLILVTTPDIETYAPFVRAVFDAPGRENDRIPYSIADRSVRKEGSVIDAFMALLDLDRERFSLSRVLAVLETPSALRRFNLTEQELETLRRWTDETGIRWGLDGRDRSRHDLPPLEENTWSAGLRRLLLGYAMTDGGGPPFEGILPYDGIEGGGTEILDKLLEAASAMFECLPSLDRPRTPEAWGRDLTEILDRFFAPDEGTEREFLALRRALNEFIEAAAPEGPGVDEPLSLDVVRYILGRRLEREGLGFGFMTGGVTFCAMLPMRSIPFRVICCLGMNSDAFPKTHRPPDFDLIARHPRPGDRSRRNDDRYLFLETILSARTHLHMSYVGQNQQDNSSLPPSVLVSELLDIIEQGFSAPGGSVLDRIFVRHRLQPFSPGCFDDDSPLRPYSEENLAAAEALLDAPRAPSAFIPAPLDPPGPEWRHITPEGLIRFFKKPSPFFLRQRLGVVLEEGFEPPEDREPFSIEGLERYALGQDAVEQCLRAGDPLGGFERAKASGRLPHGPAGRNLCEDLARTAGRLAQGVAPYVEGDSLEPVDVRLEIGGFEVTGSVDGVYTSGRVQYRFAPVQPKDRLAAWILHLILNAAGAFPSETGRTVLIGLASGRPSAPAWEEMHYGPVLDAKERLSDLLERYCRGLSLPLPFFPRTSWTYAHALLVRERTEEEALESARRVWEGNRHVGGEADESRADICFRDQDPLGTRAFHDEAVGVFGPLIRSENEEKKAP